MKTQPHGEQKKFILGDQAYILTDPGLCPSRYASQLASDPAKGGHGVISIYGRAVNKDARCLNTMSIFDGSEERKFSNSTFSKQTFFLILFSLVQLSLIGYQISSKSFKNFD